MDLEQLAHDFPHLLSPAALAYADTNGKFQIPRHIAYANKLLMEAWMTDDSRLMMNWPFQHGKSWLCSQYFPAWVLLLFPETRIALGAYAENFAATFGLKVRGVVERWGKELGVRLSQDSKAKNEWVIEGHEGGMVCKGPHGGLTGRPADLLLLDDLLKDASEAQSPTILESRWDWYCTVAFSRLGPRAPIISVGTRWCEADWFGRVLAEALLTGEDWRVVKFKAIAEEADTLGRKPGEALWPQRVPLKRLQMVQAQRPKWFNTCYQQEPSDSTEHFFRPKDWPTFTDVGDAYRIGWGPQSFIPKQNVRIFCSVDWATSEKETADFTAIATWGLCPDGRLLLLDVYNKQVRLEKCPSVLAEVCRRWRPLAVIGEDDVLSLAQTALCRQFSEIPEVRRSKIGGRNKLQRAQYAITWCENGRVHRPEPEPHWWKIYSAQLGAFTGTQPGHDDLVDVTGLACKLAQEWRQSSEVEDDYGIQLVGSYYGQP